MEPLGLVHSAVKTAPLFDSSGRSLPTEARPESRQAFFS